MFQLNNEIKQSGLATKIVQRKPELEDVKFMICDDCKHNCLTYEPSNDGTCLCECHSLNN
jgi:hypothetical protein